MARKTIPLSDVQVRNAKATDGKQATFFDGGGLYLLVRPTGEKGWRFKYRLHSKDKLMSFGTYPEVSLSEAREKRSEARKLVEQGIDPLQVRAEEKHHQKEVHENTFQKVALEWLGKQGTLAESTLKLNARRLERDIFPAIGQMPISGIKPKQILDLVIRPMELRGAGVLSRRVKSIMSQVFCYGVGYGYVERDPTTDITKSLQQVVKGNRAAITDPAELAPLLRAIDNYDGSHVVKCALQLLPLLFARPGELRAMRWQDIDLEAAEWRYTAPKTKKEVIVPLAKQVLEILESLRPLTGHIELCFPSIRSALKPISDNTFNAAFRRMGFDKDTVSAHGFRATFRTIADEVLQQRFEHIEHQLGHAVKDANGTAYNRTKHLPERHQMMQLWAGYLEGLKEEKAKVIPIRKNGTE
jgi:integrase